MHIFGTSIFVNGNVDPQELYLTCLRQILFYDGRNIHPSDIPLIAGTKDGLNHFLINPEADLKMLMGVWYKDEGDLITGAEAHEAWSTSCSDTGCKEHKAQPFRVLAGFASNVHYEDERGWNAGNLHSGMTYNIGGFLDSQKLEWKWQEGLQKGIHEGYEDLDGLPGLVGNVCHALANPGQYMAQQLLRALGFGNENGA